MCEFRLHTCLSPWMKRRASMISVTTLQNRIHAGVLMIPRGVHHVNIASNAYTSFAKLKARCLHVYDALKLNLCTFGRVGVHIRGHVQLIMDVCVLDS